MVDPAEAARAGARPGWPSSGRWCIGCSTCGSSSRARSSRATATCGKEAARAARGQKHGPYFVLSTRSGGKGGFQYLEEAQAEEASDLVERHREFQDGIRRLRKVNAELVTLLRRYQAAMARQGRRRLAAGAVAS